MAKATSACPIPNHQRSIEEAAEEVHRELCVRRRIYGRWVQDKKLTIMEAKERGERMEAALHFLMTHMDMTPGFEPKEQDREVIPPPF